MGVAFTEIIPEDGALLRRFGGGSEEGLRANLRALYAFLADKPKNTRRSYATVIKQFFSTYGWPCPAEVDVAMVTNYKRKLIDMKRSEATVNQRLSALSSYFNYLRRPVSASVGGLVAHNPVTSVSRTDIVPDAIPIAMPWPVFKKILEAMPNNVIGLRDRAMLLFMAFTGRRRAEVSSLRVCDLDLGAKPRTYVCRVKGGQRQRWELPEVCWQAISSYWVASGRLPDMQPEHAVFTATPWTADAPYNSRPKLGSPLGPHEILRALVRAARRAGVSGPYIHPHALRHMAARDLEQAGVDVRGIQEFLGHKSIATTERYLERVTGVRRSFEGKLAQLRERLPPVLDELGARLEYVPESLLDDI